MDGPPESKSDSLVHFGRFRVLAYSRGLIRFHGQKNGPGVDPKTRLGFLPGKPHAEVKRVIIGARADLTLIAKINLARRR